MTDFSLESTSGKTFKLSESLGKVVVLFFYPKDATPGCTIEGQDFTRLHGEFKSANAEVYGISRDSIKSHEKFKEKQNYSIDLLSDSEEKACRYFGVIKEKNMYGRMVMGIERSTFVIDGSGRLIKEWRKVSVPGHAEEVLNFVKSL
ncbi:MAG: peroxiredoxin [Bdellovibrionales bacterium]|nr:peroxiredoxin [Bdellovibrionales bacterium]